MNNQLGKSVWSSVGSSIDSSVYIPVRSSIDGIDGSVKDSATSLAWFISQELREVNIKSPHII